MKRVILFFVLFFQMNLIHAQQWCDSVLVTCDSVFIDSIIFTSFPETGERSIFQITTQHDFLYAPNFIICPNGNIEIADNTHGYFSIYGEATIYPYYDYLNNDELVFSGNIVVDNSNNTFDNCIISFDTIFPNQSTAIIENFELLGINVFPNPVVNELSINLINNDVLIKDISLVDILGREYQLKLNSSLIDISFVPKGIYILLVEMENGDLLSEKIIIGNK